MFKTLTEFSDFVILKPHIIEYNYYTPYLQFLKDLKGLTVKLDKKEISFHSVVKKLQYQGIGGVALLLENHYINNVETSVFINIIEKFCNAIKDNNKDLTVYMEKFSLFYKYILDFSKICGLAEVDNEAVLENRVTSEKVKDKTIIQTIKNFRNKQKAIKLVKENGGSSFDYYKKNVKKQVDSFLDTYRNMADKSIPFKVRTLDKFIRDNYETENKKFAENEIEETFVDTCICICTIPYEMCNFYQYLFDNRIRQMTLLEQCNVDVNMIADFKNVTNRYFYITHLSTKVIENDFNEEYLKSVPMLLRDFYNMTEDEREDFTNKIMIESA